MSGAVSAERRIAAAAVHALTASGVVWAFLALIAAVSGDWKAMFVWLGVALFVDGIDGPLARKVGITQVLPKWNGEVLDLVVDYLTYVFIPAYAAVAAGLFPPVLGIVGAAIICLTSAAFFAKRDQKSEDNYFIGFPTVWNLVLFYWMVFEAGPWVVFGTTVLFGALTFLPVHFVHPVRVARFREITAILVLAAMPLAILAIAEDLDPDPWVKVGLAVALVWLLAVSALRTVRGPDV